MDPEDATELLGASLANALSELQRAAGGTSMCNLSRNGTPVPTLKYREGAWAALAEVKRQSTHGSTTVIGASESTARTWFTELERLRSRGAGPDWLAYRQGGVDAIAQLVDAVADPPSSA